MRLEPASRQQPEPLTLAGRHRFGRRAERVTAAGLHLAERDRVGVSDDEIELALSNPPIAVEHRVTGGRVPLGNRVFAVLTHESSSVSHALQRSLPGSSSTFTSLKVTTRTSATNRVFRYMSHTQASRNFNSK